VHGDDVKPGDMLCRRRGPTKFLLVIAIIPPTPRGHQFEKVLVVAPGNVVLERSYSWLEAVYKVIDLVDKC
jgi:hypothetical protein